ncbi:MAG: hypothetical protein J3Q66DRAFT_391614 [Benniella sp.]|nr:MAG: hypothetical protein J3Q66DRAFT_391614 [Benniella sp.]
MHSRDPDQKLGIPREPEAGKQLANAVLALCPNPERCVLESSAQLCQACLEQLRKNFQQTLSQMIENPSDAKNQAGSGARTPDVVSRGNVFTILEGFADIGQIDLILFIPNSHCLNSSTSWQPSMPHRICQFPKDSTGRTYQVFSKSGSWPLGTVDAGHPLIRAFLDSGSCVDYEMDPPRNELTVRMNDRRERALAVAGYPLDSAVFKTSAIEEQQIPILAIANSSVSADIFGGHMDLQQSVQQLQPQFQHSQQTNVLHDPSATRLESSFMQLGPMHNGPPARQEQYGMSSQLALEPEPIPPHETTVHNPSTKEAIPNIDPRLMSSSDPEKLRSYQIPLSNSQSEQVGAPSVAQCPSPATGSYTGGGARPQGGIRTKKSTGPKILRRRITVEEMRRIKELRDRQGTSYSVIGKMFGRSKSTVHRIVHGNDTQALIPGPEDPGGDSRWEENNGLVEKRDQ